MRNQNYLEELCGVKNEEKTGVSDSYARDNNHKESDNLSENTMTPGPREKEYRPKERRKEIVG